MANLSVNRSYEDGQILLGANLDNFLDDIETFINITRLNSDNIQDDGITANTKFINTSITTSKIANNAVTTTKIQDGSINVDKLASNSVTTEKLKDSAVTQAKMAPLSVNAAKLSENSVAQAHVAPDAVTTIKITDESVTAAKLATGEEEADWVLGRTATAAAGAVGTYAMLFSNSAEGSKSFNATSGSGLLPSNGNGTTTGSAVSGTWRCMGRSTTGGNQENVTIWLRIS